MDRHIEVGILYDFYGELLTVKQRKFMELYYGQDYSLAEIAEITAITRQAVRDHLQRAQAQLIHFESVLGYHKRCRRMQEIVGDMKQNLSEDEADLHAKLEQLLDCLTGEI